MTRMRLARGISVVCAVFLLAACSDKSAEKSAASVPRSPAPAARTAPPTPVTPAAATAPAPPAVFARPALPTKPPLASPAEPLAFGAFTQPTAFASSAAFDASDTAYTADSSIAATAASAPAASATSATSATSAPQSPVQLPSFGSIMELKSPEQSARTMVGFSNLGATSYANAALKFLIHSAGPLRLEKHLEALAAARDKPQREAAQYFLALLKSSYSETGAASKDLQDFFDSLQKLLAFASLDAAGEPKFPITGREQDSSDFLMKLSQSFALHTLYAKTIALHDDGNGLKTEAEYWSILPPASADDSLQDVFDRTPAAKWHITPRQDVQYLSVRVKNAAHDAQDKRPGHRNFNFNQAVRLQVAQGDRNRRVIFTLEPREVIEFLDGDDGGHYRVYAKDGKWVQHDDDQLTILDQMPELEEVRMINFAITRVEIGS